MELNVLEKKISLECHSGIKMYWKKKNLECHSGIKYVGKKENFFRMS